MSQVIWVTGLSGSGKTTLATELVKKLRSQKQSVIQLDGDELREVFGVKNNNVQNYDRENRLALAMQYALLCRMLSSQGMTVVISTISLFKEIHIWNRKHLYDYFEVFLEVPIEELRRRDSKNIYKRFDNDAISNVAGLDLEIDIPLNADWVVKFDKYKTVNQLVKELLCRLNEENDRIKRF